MYGSYYKIKQKIITSINSVFRIFYYELLVCHCEKYEAFYPRASQVKEKYATLRMYLSCGTDEMFDLIDEAEEASDKTCEECGNSGSIRNNCGWFATLCDTHAVDQDGNRIPTLEEIRDEMP